MEQMINFVFGAISTIVLGLVTNYISDKIKNHSSTANRKSGLELDIKIKFNKFR